MVVEAMTGGDTLVGRTDWRRGYQSMHVEPQSLIGTWRRFGAYGPVYEILSEGQPLPEGEPVMRVRVIESGEELKYRLTKILDDPQER
jgi:hypothetical protein